jgi:hypothetical protein
MSRTFKSITVWGKVYSNVKVELNDQGTFESGYIPHVGAVDKDSMVAQVINNIIAGE